MTKLNLKPILNDARLFVSKRSPEILTGIGIAGMITTTIVAVKATPKALKLIEEKKKELQVDKLSPVETIKTAWKPYIPAIITGVTSTGCLIGATSLNVRRTAALATAYKLSETALSEYREKVTDYIGERKEKSLRDEIAEDRIQKNPVTKSEVIITDKGKTLCFDQISGRYFYSTIEAIKRAELNVKEEILKSISGYASLNDFYDELGLDHISVGDDLGWNIDNPISLDFSSQLNDNGEPSVVLDYMVAPRHNYHRFS